MRLGFSVSEIVWSAIALRRATGELADRRLVTSLGYRIERFAAATLT
jgi:hypothetical protein